VSCVSAVLHKVVSLYKLMLYEMSGFCFSTVYFKILEHRARIILKLHKCIFMSNLLSTIGKRSCVLFDVIIIQTVNMKTRLHAI